MFNEPLKGRVAGLINEIAALPESATDNSWSWWPKEFGQPSMVSSQNNVRYAYFPTMSRLVVEEDKVVSIYDTTGLTVYGASQQEQGNVRMFVLNTSAGPLPLAKLRRV